MPSVDGSVGSQHNHLNAIEQIVETSERGDAVGEKRDAKRRPDRNEACDENAPPTRPANFQEALHDILPCIGAAPARHQHANFLV